MKKTIDVANDIILHEPKKSRHLIEYLEHESRTFGKSYPDNLNGDKCENSFWKLKISLKIIIGSMTVNERLYLFGYLDDYEKPNTKNHSDRERIEQILFKKNNPNPNTMYIKPWLHFGLGIQAAHWLK